MFNWTKLFAVALTFAVMTGCASVPMDTPEADAALKTFTAPAADKAGLYIYRDSFVGAALKKTVKVDDQAIGETATAFTYRLLTPGTHTIATESEFSDNNLVLTAVGGQNYYVRQSIKMGVFVGGAKLTQVSEAVGQEHLQKCKLAK